MHERLIWTHYWFKVWSFPHNYQLCKKFGMPQVTGRCSWCRNTLGAWSLLKFEKHSLAKPTFHEKHIVLCLVGKLFLGDRVCQQSIQLPDWLRMLLLCFAFGFSHRFHEWVFYFCTFIFLQTTVCYLSFSTIIVNMSSN